MLRQRDGYEDIRIVPAPVRSGDGAHCGEEPAYDEF